MKGEMSIDQRRPRSKKKQSEWQTQVTSGDQICIMSNNIQGGLGLTSTKPKGDPKEKDNEESTGSKVKQIWAGMKEGNIDITMTQETRMAEGEAKEEKWSRDSTQGE